MCKNSHANSKKKNTVISLFLICALLITGIFAFLTATDSKTNRFTVGNVDIDLVEEFDTNQDGDIDPDETYRNEQPPVVENIIPGQVITKEPWVENTGNNDAWIYLVVSVPTATPSEVASNSMHGEDIEVVVKAFAIQDNYKSHSDLDEIWEAYGYDFGGVQPDTGSTRVELFNILHSNGNKLVDGFNTTDWTLLDNFCGDDNNNYYVLGLNSMLPADSDTTSVATTEISASAFDAVKLITDIGTELRTVSFYRGPNLVSAPAFITENDIIPVPANNENELWVAENGFVISPASTIVENVLIRELNQETKEFEITNLNPIVSAAALSNSASQPKLLPAPGTEIAIERNGVAESYYNYDVDSSGTIDADELPRGTSSVLAPNTNRYSNANGFSNYFVFGVPANNGFTESEINELFTVDGEGYVVIQPSKFGGHGYPIYGTNTIISLYNLNDEIVEKFTLIEFGDLDKDDDINGNDIGKAKAYFTQREGYYAESYYSYLTNTSLLLKTADLNNDNVINAADVDILRAVNAHAYDIDIHTGYTPDTDRIAIALYDNGVPVISTNLQSTSLLTFIDNDDIVGYSQDPNAGPADAITYFDVADIENYTITNHQIVLHAIHSSMHQINCQITLTKLNNDVEVINIDDIAQYRATQIIDYDEIENSDAIWDEINDAFGTEDYYVSYFYYVSKPTTMPDADLTLNMSLYEEVEETFIITDDYVPAGVNMPKYKIGGKGTSKTTDFSAQTELGHLWYDTAYVMQPVTTGYKFIGWHVLDGTEIVDVPLTASDVDLQYNSTTGEYTDISGVTYTSAVELVPVIVAN